MEWRVRVHDVVLPQAILSWADHYATEQLVVHHSCGSERPHHHLWIKTSHAEQTIRKLPKYLKLTNGNSDFSIQKCDPTRRDEQLQQMFNLKNGNVPEQVADKGVPNWNDYKESAMKCTEEQKERKTKEKAFTKNDMIDLLIDVAPEGGYGSLNDLYDKIMIESRNHRTVFSINAIREILTYVAFSRGSSSVADQTKSAVLKIFS